MHDGKKEKILSNPAPGLPAYFYHFRPPEIENRLTDQGNHHPAEHRRMEGCHKIRPQSRPVELQTRAVI
jgi:hypothetical protein